MATVAVPASRASRPIASPASVLEQGHGAARHVEGTSPASSTSRVAVERLAGLDLGAARNRAGIILFLPVRIAR
jgi:hypothetical protein